MYVRVSSTDTDNETRALQGGDTVYLLALRSSIAYLNNFPYLVTTLVFAF